MSSRYLGLNVWVLVLLSSCSLQSSQLDALIMMLKERSPDLLENSWSVRHSNYKNIVYAVQTPEGTIFSNQEGDQILFDGWSIIRIDKIGRSRSRIKIDDLDGNRLFARGNRVVANHVCDKWRKQERLGSLRYTQNCSGSQAYTNSIFVTKDGKISIIRQIVDDTYTVMTLTKLN
jgi:hypothetical protein